MKSAGINMEVDELDTGLLEKFGCMQTVDQADLVGQMRRLVGGEDAISESCARFYLEMSNWNVHGAVGHYFDLNSGGGADRGRQNHSSSSLLSGPETAPPPTSINGVSGPFQPSSSPTRPVVSAAGFVPSTMSTATTSTRPLPAMKFDRDETVGEGESVPPSTHFKKTWRLSNPGPDSWPPGCSLRFAGGSHIENDAVNDRLELPPLGTNCSAEVSLRMRSPDQPGMYESRWQMVTPEGAYFGDTIWVILSVEHSGTLALTQQMDQFHDLGKSSRERLSGHGAGSGGASESSVNALPEIGSSSSSPTIVIDCAGANNLNPFSHHQHLQQQQAKVLFQQRPSSPTDQGQGVVNARELLLYRTLASSTDGGGDDAHYPQHHRSGGAGEDRRDPRNHDDEELME